MSIELGSVGARTGEHTFTYDWQKAALYALAIGARRDELSYLYEAHDFRVFPTFAVIPTMAVVHEAMGLVKLELASIVHHAQELTLHRPLAASGKLVTRGEVRAIYDMKRMAQVVIGTESRDEAGELVAESEWTLLTRGVGGFGGQPPPRKADEGAVMKQRPADFQVEQATSTEQALLYRLTGDLNPLHADPALAAQVGFAQGPILHGLCTLGFAARALVGALLGGDGGKLKKIGAQFRRPVWPGDALVTEGWKIDGGRVVLQTLAKNRPEPVLTGAWAQVDL